MQSRHAVRGIVALALATLCATSCANSRGRPEAPSTDVALTTLVAPPPPADPPAPPPFELTSSDGVGLRIASVRASAVIDDPLALTELHLVFQNTEPRRIEGRFTLALPPRASLGRFAMRVGGVLQEGEIVEKQEARLTYEEYLHVRRDPALLEQGAANEVAVRVFPIEPGELKEIVVTYSEALDGAHPYRLRLAGLPAIGELSASAYVAGEEVATASLHEERPASDLVVEPSRWKTGVVGGLAGGRDVALRVPVPGASTPEPEADAVVALVDTSASRSLDFVRELDALARRAAALPAATRLVVIAYDQDASVAFDGDAGAFDDAARAKIGARHALGATDLARALRFAATIPPRAPGERRRLFVFGDGIATAGLHEPRDLADATAALSLAGFSRADVIAIGGLQDDAALGSIARGALPSSGGVVSVDEDEAIVAKRLGTTTIDPANVSVAGASFVYPTRLVGAQPGDDVIVHASFAASTAPSTVTVSVGNVKRDVSLRSAPAPFVARSVAAERIARIESDPDLAEPDKRSQVVALAKKYRVESAYTGMLVLEDDAAYERHHIDRKSKLDVLGIRDRAVAITSSARPTLGVPSTPDVGHDPATISAPPPASPPSSSPAPSPRPSSHVSRPPAVRMGATMVSGRLPPEVVQRIVRLGFGRFRGCYQAALVGHPTLSGRATMSFLIGLDGSVASVAASSSDLPESVRVCLTRAFASLTFPPPEGGVVRVTYPLVFTPEGTTSQAPLSLDAFRPTRRLSSSFSAAPDYHRDPLAGAGSAPLYDGALGEVMTLVNAGRPADALAAAWTLEQSAPSDVLSLVALGRAAEAARDPALASRAYGSILELWSYRADMRRFAGEMLEHVGRAPALALATDAYEGAAIDRPDHPSSHWLLALNLLRRGHEEQAFEALEKGVARDYAMGQFAGATRLLRDDLATVGAAWARVAPDRADEIASRLAKYDRKIDAAPSIRMSVVWETDANDVDLYVTDAAGEHAWYAHPQLASGGQFYADVTTGYGPEGFLAPLVPEKEQRYRLRVHYYARGPMGFGMGKVVVMKHDGAGVVSFDDRPFVLTSKDAIVDLGVFDTAR